MSVSCTLYTRCWRVALVTVVNRLGARRLHFINCLITNRRTCSHDPCCDILYASTL